MGAALVLLLVGLGALAAGVLIGRYYVPDDRQLRRTARHGRAFMRALSHMIARDHDTVVRELRGVVEENIDDVEPYFALGAMFRSRGEHERAIRTHQALAMREKDRRKLRLRAIYELALDFRAAGMPRRATRAMEEVLLEEPGHGGALRALAALYEEQARFAEAAELWQRLGARRGEDLTERQHHLYVAAAQAALGRGDPDGARALLKNAQKLVADGRASAHFFAAAAELAAARSNWRGARERLKQALVAEPGLVAQLLPELTCAEGQLVTAAGGVAAATVSLELPAVSDELADAAVSAPDGAEDAEAAEDALAEPAPPSPIAALTPAATPAASPSPSASPSPGPDGSVALVPVAAADALGAHARVVATLAEIEQLTGPRLELALVRAQLAPPEDADAIARELVARFPDAIAARVAAGRLALAARQPAAVASALEALVGDAGALAWALRGRWQCSACRHRPASFSWRCGTCRRWGTLVIETGVEPPREPPRERRAAPRPLALLGAAPDAALPAPALDLPGDELAGATARRSLLGRVGGWMTGAWRR